MAEINAETDVLPPKTILSKLAEHDVWMDELRGDFQFAKATVETRFWRWVRSSTGSRDRKKSGLREEAETEVNRTKPALSGYVNALYPRSMKIELGRTARTTGDIDKGSRACNDWYNRERMRERVLLAARQGLMYGAAGTKVCYDTKHGSNKLPIDRVWTRVFPVWELFVDKDATDWDDQRFIGHVYYRPKKEVEEEYDLDGLTAGRRLDFLDLDRAGASKIKHNSQIPDSGVSSLDSEWVRVLEVCNLVDTCEEGGATYQGRFEVYVLDAGGQGGSTDPVFVGPMPLSEPNGDPLAHIFPLIFDHEAEHPLRGLAYIRQLLPQQKEINVMTSYAGQAARRDARMYLARKGSVGEDAKTQLTNGEDGTIIFVDQESPDPLEKTVVPLHTSPISGNVLENLERANSDFERNLTRSPMALGQTMKSGATATEVMAIESHTESEYGRHAEQRDIWLTMLIWRFIRALVATMTEPAPPVMRDEEDEDTTDEATDTELEDSDAEEESEEEESEEGEEEESEEDEEEEEEEEDDEAAAEGYAKLEAGEEEEEETDDDAVLRDSLGPEDDPDVLAPQTFTETDTLILLAEGADDELVEVVPDDLDGYFKVGFSETGRSPMDEARMQQVLAGQVTDKYLQLLEVVEKQRGLTGLVAVAAEEIVRAIATRFQLPTRMQFDALMAEAKRRQGEAPPDAPAPEEAPPEEAPPEGGGMPAPTPENVDQLLEGLMAEFGEDPNIGPLLARIAQMPTPEARAEGLTALMQQMQGGGEEPPPAEAPPPQGGPGMPPATVPMPGAP